jgi:hypothetical protein
MATGRSVTCWIAACLVNHVTRRVVQRIGVLMAASPQHPRNMDRGETLAGVSTRWEHWTRLLMAPAFVDGPDH